MVPNDPASAIIRVFKMQSEHQHVMRLTTAKDRIKKLQRFHDYIYSHRQEIENAVWLDFKKPKTEAMISELGVLLGETRHTIRNLKQWMRPKGVSTPITLFGSSSEIIYEPKGVCLVLSPWNFPFNLSLVPVVSAVAAGNCVILKPSEYAPHSSALMKKMIADCFPPEEVTVFEGDVSVSSALLELPFNHIFFTGSPNVAKVVMAAAAKNLASVTLELGGKSPVVVDKNANIDNAGAKIAWLKAMNAGQTCIAPDYILVHESVKTQLIAAIVKHLKKFYGEDAAARQATPDLCRMISPKHYGRVKHLLEDAVQRGARVEFGGHLDDTELYFENTILSDIPDDAEIWSDEIFGPVLLIRTWSTKEEAATYINSQPDALSMYIFSNSGSVVNYFLKNTRNGGVTVNDCGPHFYNSELPFGGVNNSGMGKCHGHFGFMEFTNQRGVLRQTRFLPTTDFMVPPYGGWLAGWLLKGIVRWF